ncbi:MAG: HDOD domain-containing protein, partial [Syntrophales bacterium]|nr:HDOD domain-containing protein [Syntrophales bacterium]
RLSTLPTIFTQINKVISDPNSSAQDIAEVIEKDTYVSAKILRIVNSAFYVYPSRIAKISRAVTIIGTKQLGTLAGGINILRIFRNIPSRLIDMKSFWEHSLLCGINARIMGGYKNIPNTERLFVAGMLHDIGRLLLYNYLPELTCHIIEKAAKEKKPLYQAEREVMGIDHSSIAESLFKQRRLPMSLESIVRYHHQPLESLNRTEASIIHLADMMAIAMGLGTSGERRIPPLETGAWELLGVSTNILAVTADQAQKQMKEIFDYFFEDAD